MAEEHTQQPPSRGKSRRERVEYARSRDILDVASELDMELVRSGRDYRWKEHDSMVISPDKNMWNWFSRHQGGDVISLVETMKEVNFNQAIDYLNDGSFKEYTAVERVQEPFSYYLEPYEQPFEAARTYLKEQRGLSDETINFFLDKGVLAQANAKVNGSIEPVVVFKSFDFSGEIVGATLQGIEENWDKWPERGYAKNIVRNSDGITGLHVDIGQPNRLIFAESAIDLMSYYELHKDTLQDVRLVSMDGVKEAVIGRHLAQLQSDISGRPLRWSHDQLAEGLRTAIDNNFFADGKHEDWITLAVDNDTGGRNFIDSLREKGAIINEDLPDLQPGQNKTDWNDALKNPPVDNGRLGQSKRKLERLNHEFMDVADEPSVTADQSSGINFLNQLDQNSAVTPVRPITVLKQDELYSDYWHVYQSDGNLEFYLSEGGQFGYRQYGSFSPKEDNIIFKFHSEAGTTDFLATQMGYDDLKYIVNKDWESLFDSDKALLRENYVFKDLEDFLQNSDAFELDYWTFDDELKQAQKVARQDEEFLDEITKKDLTKIDFGLSNDNRNPEQTRSEEQGVLFENLADVTSTPNHNYRSQVSYDIFKANQERLSKAVQSQIQAGALRITLSDEAYFYTLVNYTGWSHPMQQLKPQAIDSLKEYRTFFESINDTNIDRFKEKGTPEQNQMYELLKGLQKELGRSNTSTVFSEEVAISAYNINRQLVSLTAENWGKGITDPLGALGRDTWNIISYPANDIVTGNTDYYYQIVPYHLLEYLNGKNGTVEISPGTYDHILRQLRNEEIVITPEVVEEVAVSSEQTISSTKESENPLEVHQGQDVSEQHKKNETNIRDLSEQAQEAAPLPEATPSQPLKDLSPSQTESHSLLHFTIENPKRSIYKDNYHPIKTHELNKLNHHAPNIQSAAQWYLDNLSDTTLHYFYQQGNKQYNINIEFEQYHFMHLTGLFPLKRGQTAVKTLHDFAEGRGTYDNLMIADNEAAFQKIKVLPDLKAIMETDAFYFDQVEDIPKLQSLSLEKAIKSDDKDVLLAFSSNEENIYPASLMELTKQLKIQTEQSQHQNVILGVYQERDGKFTQLSINEAYITDNGEEMLSILKGEQVSSDEPSHDLTPSPTEALIDAATFTKVLDTAYNVGNPADLGVEVPEEFQASWEQYNQLSEASLGDFKTIIAKADELGLLDKTTAFYQDWQQDQIYNDTYHVRLRSSNEGPNSPQLPFEPTHLVSYQDFVTEVYKANQDVSRTKPVAFDIYAPGGALIKEGVRYAIGDETQPVSRLLGLGYRRLEDYPNLAAIDEKVLSQLENQEVNQSIATEANEQTVASQETPQEGSPRGNFQSPKQGVKNGLAQRVEEIMAEDATKILVSSIPQVQENLSIEGDLIGTPQSDGQMLYTNQEDNDFQVKRELEKLASQIGVGNSPEGLYKQEEIDAFLTNAKGSKPDQRTQENTFSAEPFDYKTASAYDVSERAFQKIREYTQSPEDLMEYMEFMSKFPQLSPRNVALIQEQWKGANAVATYDQWKSMGEALGIKPEDVIQTKATYTNKRTGETKEVVHQGLSVKTGEKSQITLFRPLMVRMIPILDENGHQLKNEKGNPKYKKLSEATLQEKALVKDGKLPVRQFQERDPRTGQPRFTTYKVFELSQTTLKPESYPKAMPNRHYNFDTDKVKTKEVLESLCDYAESIGITMMKDEAHVLGNAKGAFYPEEQLILINPDNTPGEKIATTIHELAHATLHNPKLADQYQELPKGQKEFEAEMTSHVLSKYFGLDTSEKAIDYMASWTDNLKALDDKQLTDSLKRVHKTVSNMMKHVENHTKPYSLGKNRGQAPNFPKSPIKGPSR